MEIARAVLAAAELTVLQISAFAQVIPAPADAFRYVIWPPDGTTVKGAFW
jgi:hypothetical protein